MKTVAKLGEVLDGIVVGLSGVGGFGMAVTWSGVEGWESVEMTGGDFYEDRCSTMDNGDSQLAIQFQSHLTSEKTAGR